MNEFKSFSIKLDKESRERINIVESTYILTGAFVDEKIKNKTKFSLEENYLKIELDAICIKIFNKEEMSFEIDLKNIEPGDIECFWNYPNYDGEIDLFDIIKHFKDKEEYEINDFILKIELDEEKFKINKIAKIKPKKYQKIEVENFNILNRIELCNVTNIEFHQYSMLSILNDLQKYGELKIDITETNIPGHGIYLPIFHVKTNGLDIIFHDFKPLRMEIDVEKYGESFIVNYLEEKCTFNSVIENDKNPEHIKYLKCKIAKDCMHFLIDTKNETIYRIGYTL